ncbi:MAG: efflux RND transporter permease subunit [Acidobacteria bacterium]|nr:efflux RND transporter permease subunit [Acidobacteriota bacterium]
MTIIKSCIRYPVSTAVGVILIVLFGGIALVRLPVQLTPNVDKPVITIETIWPGASPLEVEREIVDEQEEQLKSLEGLIKMESTSRDSAGDIKLRFQVGTDIDSALLKVSNRLNQVQEYPRDAEKPVIRSADGGADARAIAWFALLPTEENGFEGDMSTLFDFVDDFIKPEFERVPGIATANIYGGRKREMHVIVDPARLAARNVTLNDLAAALDRENRNYSAGDFDEGKRRYTVRTVGEYRSAEDIENVVIAVRNGVPIFLRDVAEANLGYRKTRGMMFEFGKRAMAMNAVKEPDSNLLEVMAGLKEAMKTLNENLLEPRGLTLRQVYDQTDYVNSAINLVSTSLLIGGVLAMLVLILFLRSFSSTLVISAAIPISIIGTFLMMSWFDRSINVISLAGLAFAAGMVVDNSIVVLENIYRHRQMGKSGATAAFDGAREVWGAVLASTLTTIAVFVPVVFIQEEVGQLFGDIAVAISCAVGLSLIVAITVIPSLSAKILRTVDEDEDQHGFHSLWGVVNLARGLNRRITDTVSWINSSTVRCVAVVLIFTLSAIGLSWVLTPKADYLPTGNQNFLFGIVLPPPGYNVAEVASLNDVYNEELSYLWEHPAGSPEAEAQPGGGVEDFFFGMWRNMVFMGASANDPMRVGELRSEFQRVTDEVPGAISRFQQSSIFDEGLGGGRSIEIQIVGPDLEHLMGLGKEVFARAQTSLPTAQVFPLSSLDLDNPELQLTVHRRRAAELGLSNRDLGFAISVLVDGAKASDYKHEGKEIDLRVMARKGATHRTHLIEQMPIATPDGRLVTLGSVVDVELTRGPVQIVHRERQRAISIAVMPSETMELEIAIDTLKADVIGPMRAEGKLGGLYRTTFTGSAEKLSEAATALKWNLLLALAITYLLMAALFESFLYPLVIMFSVPLAAFGGFLGLKAVNVFLTFQPLDVLTMLGFIILVGTVVNNAILIVHQSLNHMREEGMDPREAIRAAVSNRVRPIFMSIGTSSLGMMPLILFPGAGSELYRGIGGVVVGGLIVSTVFTLFLVPAVFSLALDVRTALASTLRGMASPVRRPAARDESAG